jgi:hypothetical protein
MKNIYLVTLIFIFIQTSYSQVRQTSFPAANGSVKSISRFENTVFICGEFDSIGGVPRHNIAAVDANTGAVLTWNPSPNGTVVEDLLVVSNKLILCGNFTTISGVSTNYIAVYDVNTLNFLPTNVTNAAGNCRSLCSDGNFVYYNAGPLDTYQRFNLNTLLIDSWTTPSCFGSGILFNSAVLGNYLYVGGSFNIYTVSPSLDNIARFKLSDGSLDSNWTIASGSGSYIMRIRSYNNKLYVAGSFTQIGGVNQKGVAEIDTAGFVTTKNFNCSNSQCYALYFQGNTIWIGGNSANIGGYFKQRIAQVNLSTGYATCWDIGGSGIGNASYVKTIWASSDTVYIGTPDGSSFFGKSTAFIGNPSYISLGPDLNICPPAPFTLNANSNGFSSFQWSNGANTPTISSSTSGTYWVTANSASNCYATDTIVVNFCTSTEELGLQINPLIQNPVGDVLQLNPHLFSQNKSLTLEIYDLSGKIVFKKVISSSETDCKISSLNIGFYTLRIFDENEVLAARKFIKSN